MKLLIMVLVVLAGTTFSLGAEASSSSLGDEAFSRSEIWRLMDKIDLELRNEEEFGGLGLMAQHLEKF